MELKDYKKWQPKYMPTWIKPKGHPEIEVEWAILEMCGEAGEVLELFQKSYRKRKDIDRDKLKDELSDVLWGFTAILNANGWTFEEIAQYNHDKLEARNKE